MLDASERNLSWWILAVNIGAGMESKTVFNIVVLIVALVLFIIEYKRGF
jgi:hypothetical protein